MSVRSLILGHTHGFSQEATALFARMSVQPVTARKQLIDTVIRVLKAQGIWTKLDCLYVTAAADAQAAKLNWKSSSYNLTAVNSPTFTADRGFAGDGATSYLDMTGYTGNNVGQISGADAAFGLWQNVDAADGGGHGSRNEGAAIFPYSAPSVQTWIGNQSPSTLDSTIAANGLGYSGISRTSTSNYTLQKITTQSTITHTATAGSITSGSDFILCAERISSVSIANFTASRLAAAHIGAGLTTSQLSAMQAQLAYYLNAVGGA